MLGGGGEYFVAWMLGFAYGLNAKGVAYEMPDIIIGTSAGSVVGSAMAAGNLKRLTKEFDFFGGFPKILAVLVPSAGSNPSQIRARELCRIANNASIETIQSIGRGAMAARNPAVSNLQDMIEILTGNRSWPSPKFHATTTDCHTGERLVISEANHIPISHAASASMSLPDIFGPTWIGDRICMDGGMGPPAPIAIWWLARSEPWWSRSPTGREEAVRAFRIFRSLFHKSSGILKQREPGHF